jgi:hypothetical protein
MLFFLDIDGVMVPAASWKSPKILEDRFPMFSPKAIQALQSLISVNDTVMLTTSHKSRYTISEWKGIFERRGIKIEKLQCLANNDANLSRKDEILKWVNVNGVGEEFIIIDDDKSLNDLPKFLKDRLILTSSMVGLTNEHLGQVRAILDNSQEVA